MTRLLLLARVSGLLLLAAFTFSACSSSPDGDAPSAVRPVLSSVERHNWVAGRSSWNHLSRSQTRFLVAFANNVPPGGVPTFAVSFTGPLIRSNYEVHVGNKVAAKSTPDFAEQAVAEAADLPWFYQDPAFPRRLVIRLPNSVLLSGGEVPVSIYNVSRNPGASRKERKSEPLVFNVIVGPNLAAPAP